MEDELYTLHSPISTKEIEFVLKTSYKENPDTDGFTDEFYQTLRRNKQFYANPSG